MAYTYEQFESAASKAGLLNKFSRQDLTVAQSNPEYGISMLQLMKNRSGAKTSEQKVLADEAVRQLRNTYSGYTSGGRLPEYTDEVVQQVDNYYAGQNAYRRALAEAEGYGSTPYDKTLGNIYARQTAIDRERARADALATASASTGGRPSSYALTVAQQAGNDADAQLDKSLLGLRQNAYQLALKEAGASKTNPSTKKPANTVTPEPDKSNSIIAPNPQPSPVPDKHSDAENLGGTIGSVIAGGANPMKPSSAQAYAQHIDGNIAIKKNMGWSDNQIKEYILSCLNNDDLFGDFSDAEFAWLLEHYAQYNLV